MNYRKLGCTGLFISELGFGASTFGESWGAGIVDQKTATEMVKLCLDAGINFFDTADVYSYGASETMLGQALRDLGVARESIILATKVNGRMSQEDINAQGLSRHHILHAVDASLQRLGTDYIDLYQTHSFDPFTPLEETLKALDSLVQSGKVRYIGFCNYTGWQTAKALTLQQERGWARAVSTQLFYSVVNRDIEYELVPLAESERLGILTWSPLASGFVTGKYKRGQKPAKGTRFADWAFGEFPLFNKTRGFDILDVMRPIAESKGVSLAQLGLAWNLSKPFVASVLLGARKIEQLRENLKCTEVCLTAEERRAIDEISAPEPRYPQWMIGMFTDKMKVTFENGKK